MPGGSTRAEVVAGVPLLPPANPFPSVLIEHWFNAGSRIGRYATFMEPTSWAQSR